MKKQITLERTLTGFWLTILTSLILFATSCTATRTDIYHTSPINYEWLKKKQKDTKYSNYICWSCPKF